MGNIISTHCVRRNDMTWLYSIRGDFPEDPLIKGIIELNLEDN